MWKLICVRIILYLIPTSPVFVDYMFYVGICFGTHYFVSCLVLQSSWRGRESCLLCLNCLSHVLLLLVFWGSSSRWRGFVCSVWVWYFMIILTKVCTTKGNSIQKHALSLRSYNFTSSPKILASMMTRWLKHFLRCFFFKQCMKTRIGNKDTILYSSNLSSGYSISSNLNSRLWFWKQNGGRAIWIAAILLWKQNGGYSNC